MDDNQMDAALDAWAAKQSAADRQDPIWTLLAYRLSRFALDLAKHDIRAAGQGMPFKVRDQLLSAVASVSANIGEGYARTGGPDRRRFYTFALGSAREAVTWYSSIADNLPAGIADARISVLSRARRLLLGLISKGPPARWRDGNHA